MVGILTCAIFFGALCIFKYFLKAEMEEFEENKVSGKGIIARYDVEDGAQML